MIDARDPRVYFAAERTFLAWIRTGLAMMGFGFVVARFGLFLREMAMMRPAASAPVPTGNGSLTAGVALVLLGVIVNVYAAIAHAQFTKRFRAGDSDPRPSQFGIVTASVLAAVGFAMAVYLIARS